MFGRDAAKSVATHQTQTQVHGYRRSDIRFGINSDTNPQSEDGPRRVIEGQQPVKKPNIEVEVKDNNGKLTWYHISDIKKTDIGQKINLSTT